ncbi:MULTISPECIES: FAD-dependent monooxygenase [Frankia]|uniref:Polyketide oxygenase/hydroxylase n=1 Tax=Frankia alni (strain DSM 45986 / CECT 9034 / ACN14a) TaxID=326424 RepID=Q0RMN5_FRAAA|nr:MULTISPECIES: FAD-dependent monooxygenase [Frankia]CAJ61212.1 putative polyketide oxygenase/hydroxylase [Frankia alni ACN14a]
MSNGDMRDAGVDTDVVIAGAGPTGLMLACELRLAGVDVVLLDRLAGRTGESRAGGMHSRTLEVLDQRGVLDRFLEAGEVQSVGHFSGLWLDFDASESRYAQPLMVLQSVIERLLEEWAAELGVRVRWSSEVCGFREDSDGVTVEWGTAPAAPTTLRARYLVGCDGGRSAVRKLAGIEFPGTPATMTALLGDVELPDLPEDYIFMRRCEGGHFSAIAFEAGWYRVITSEYDRVAENGEPATFEQLRESLIRLAGTDYGMRAPRWISRFSDAARQAAQYRKGRALLAGDAAHIHYPAGGQGLNIGVQDAVNLGWKLASVVRGGAPSELLDSYHAERHPVAERVLRNTRAQSALARPGPQMDALRDVFSSLIVFDDVNRQLSGMLTALDVRYPVGGGHPLAGLRVPDADLKTSEGETSVHLLLHAARGVLLDLQGSAELAAAAHGWADRVDLVEARSEDAFWPVPVVGEISAPAALLIRPDGHVAWVAGAGDAADLAALRTALHTWFGPARSGVAAAGPGRGPGRTTSS